jgi:HprK-related kinase A
MTLRSTPGASPDAVTLVSSLSSDALRGALAGKGLRLRTGPVTACVRSRLEIVAAGIERHYAHHGVEHDDSFVDFHVSVEHVRSLRRWLKPQVIFRIDGESPFNPLPADQAFAMLEWGLNWCISSHCHQYLTIHCAVVAKGSHALLMPAPSGSGKSTLCAALALSGWRLLSDELALIDPKTLTIASLARPVSLKNKSIDVTRSRAGPHALGSTVHDTVKGTVAYLTPPREAVRDGTPATPRWVLVPTYDEQARGTTLDGMTRGATMMQLIDNAFNYSVHGEHGFETLSRVVQGCEGWRLRYADIDDALARLEACTA